MASDATPTRSPGPSPGQEARRILRRCGRAALATALAGDAGWPYPSLVLAALDHDGSPLLLLSELADHTRNIKADDRIGLLFDATAGLDEPLAGPRVSVLGRAVRTDEARHRARYLARHPSAAQYAGFRDFAFYRIEVERAHLVSGFGRIHRIAQNDLLLGSQTDILLRDQEPTILQQMESDHAGMADLYATALLGRTGTGWRIAGIDPDGCDLRRGPDHARLDFEQPVFDLEAVRAELMRLGMRARAQDGNQQPADE